MPHSQGCGLAAFAGRFIGTDLFVETDLADPNVNDRPDDSGRPFIHKAGLLGLTNTLATEFAEAGIRVNCVAPGRTLAPL